MFKIGIIGAGDIVKKAYLPLLSKRDDCKLIGICNSSIGSSIQLSKQYSLNSYNNYKELIQDKSIDTILICTPTHLHFEIAEYAISKSKNIFKEATNFKSEIREIPKQLEIYHEALDMEKQSIDLYTKLLSEATNDKEKRLLGYLIRQEKEHLEIMEELIVLINRPDDWVESAEFGVREEY